VHGRDGRIHARSRTLAALRPRVAERLGGKAEDYDLRALPGADLVEVHSRSNGRMAYVDRALHYVLLGTLYDADSKANLTSQRLAEYNRLPFDQLPLERAIKIVKGNGTPRFAVFEDPDCPFCRAMEARLEQLDDYTAYVLLLPLSDVHPNAEKVATAIWCSPDPATAWHRYLLEQKLPESRACATPIAELARIATAHNINGTPTLVMPDGEIVEGLPDFDTLKAKAAAAVAGSH